MKSTLLVQAVDIQGLLDPYDFFGGRFSSIDSRQLDLLEKIWEQESNPEHPVLRSLHSVWIVLDDERRQGDEFIKLELQENE